MQTTKMNSNIFTSELLTKKELSNRLKMRSVTMVERLMRERAIPYYLFSSSVIRFSWPDVQAALAKFEVPAVER